MVNKNTYSNNNSYSSDEQREYSGKHILNHHEFDLYHEERDVVEKLVSVKRTKKPSKGERWHIFIDREPLFIIDGNKLNKGEIDFLRTAAGFNFLIAQVKAGVKKLTKLKIELKKKVKKKKNEKI